MVGKLVFDLDNPEDAMEHLLAIHGKEFAFFIWELKNNVLIKARKNGLNADEVIDLIYEKIDELEIDVNNLVI